MSNLKLIGGYFHILINYWKWNCWSLPIFANRRFDGFTLKIVRIWTDENKLISFPQIHWTFQMNLKLIVGYLPIKKKFIEKWLTAEMKTPFFTSSLLIIYCEWFILLKHLKTSAVYSWILSLNFTGNWKKFVNILVLKNDIKAWKIAIFINRNAPIVI